MCRVKYLAVLAAMLASLCSAQEFRATISGHVYDPSGAGVPNAQVQAVHIGTNETATATSDNAGAYTLPALRPGNYKVTITAPGFKQQVRENVTLEVGRVVGIEVNLEVGAVTESVNVTAEAALLETQTASRVGVVTSTQISELPLNSRNPFMLGSMMSGVNFRGAAIWQRPFDNGAIAEWSVNGGRQSNNEFLMDGAPNNAQAGGNNIAYVPIVDAVQEFSVQQNSYDSQYGKTGGGVFNVVLKSGSNEFHGSGWEFMRRKFLDANAFQNNAVGNPRPDHALDQYGGQLSGPLWIPGLVKPSGKIKGFFLGSYEGYKEKWPQFLNASYAEPEMRLGDFSKLVTGQGQPIIIYDPLTTNANGERQPFPNNRIPADRISPVARALINYMPVPNTRTGGARYANSNWQDASYAAKDDFYNLILKFDFNIGDNHRTFFRHASNDRTEDRCDSGICEGPGQTGQQPFQRINDAYVLDWITTINPTLILNIRASNNRFVEKGFGRGNVDFDLTSLGLPASLVNSLPSPAYFGRWNFENGYSSLGRYQGINITNNYNLATNMTKIAGAHTMKFGVDIRRIHFIEQNSGDILQFQGQTRWTQRIFNQSDPLAGDAFASFLLGGVGGSVNYPLYPFTRSWYVAPYFQDDWKVSRRLTLNLGVRWDYNGAPDEKYNRLNRGFDPNAASPIAAQIPANMQALYPQLRNLRGGLQFAGEGDNPTTAWNADWNNWQPRVGAAFQISDRVVMRGGYGLYYLNPNNDARRFTGFSTNTPLVNSLDDNRTLLPNLLANPYPGGFRTPTGSSLGLLTNVGQNTDWFFPGFRTPKYHSFSFGFQLQPSQNSTIDASYVGSRSVGLNDEREMNHPSPEFRAQCNLLEGGSPAFCNQQLTNPFKGIEAFRGTTLFTADTVRRYDLMRPFPQFPGNMTVRGLNTSKIWYNSLQLNYNHRLRSGLTLLANYTLSKMVERWGYDDPVAGVPGQGLYFNDRPHYVKFSTVWELPFGAGRAIGGNATGFVNKLISGWQLSTFTQAASGEPNNLSGSVIQIKDPRKTIAGDWTGDVDWNQHRIVGWNPCVLRQNNDGTVVPQPFSIARGCGTDPANYAWLRVAEFAPSRNSPRRSGQIRKQPTFNVDLSVSKMTQITERVRFQFRAEAFNATNYFYFGRDSNFTDNPDDANFGTIFQHLAWTGNGYPRQIQLGFKVLF